MRTLLVLSVLSVTACGLPTSVQSGNRSGNLLTDPSTAQQGDQSDTSCQVILRDTSINFSSAGPQTNCETLNGVTSCWVIVTVTIDVAMSQSLNQAEPFVFYEGAGSTTFQQSAQAQPIFGAPEGFRRYQVALNTNTFAADDGTAVVQLIPYLFEVQGERLFDHNRIANALGAYTLNQDNNWTISDDSTVCPGTTPAGVETLTFSTGWTNTATGTLAQSGKLDINYDLYRIPGDLGCTTDGVDAFATTAYVQFEPDGTTLNETVSGPFNSTTGVYDSLPLEFDVPADATAAAVWFLGSSDCGANDWDSNFGQNYAYPVAN